MGISLHSINSSFLLWVRHIWQKLDLWVQSPCRSVRANDGWCVVYLHSQSRRGRHGHCHHHLQLCVHCAVAYYCEVKLGEWVSGVSRHSWHCGTVVISIPQKHGSYSSIYVCEDNMECRLSILEIIMARSLELRASLLMAPVGLCKACFSFSSFDVAWSQEYRAKALELISTVRIFLFYFIKFNLIFKININMLFILCSFLFFNK